MAKTINDSFKFSGKNIDNVVFSPRSAVNFLPAVNQTEVLQKFFNATLDQLITPGSSKPINGFIGHKPEYYDSQNDHYLSEPNSERAFYQLEPAMTSYTVDGDLQNLLFYTDFLKKVTSQGGITNNHTRMFSQKYYTWCPPIDLDKFLNFKKYVWLPEGPVAQEIYGHGKFSVGDGKNKVFPMWDGRVLTAKSQIRVFVDDLLVDFSWNIGDLIVKLDEAPAPSSVVKVFVASDIMNEVKGKKTFTFANGVTLSSGMKIHINNDLDHNLNGLHYIVEGVGKKIILAKDENPDLTREKEYITIERGSRDENPWSTSNRWFHVDVTSGLTAEAISVFCAKRPIIEFSRELELFNFGLYRRPTVDLVATKIDDLIGATSNKSQIAQDIDGYSITVDWLKANTPNASIRVLTTGDTNASVNNRVYKIYTKNNKLYCTLIADGLDTTGTPVEGEILHVNYGTLYGNNDIFWDGTSWNFAQEKTALNQAPLFQLYDTDFVKLQDSGLYPESTFNGSRLFGYKEGNGTTDKILNKKLAYDNDGNILFENFLKTETYSYTENFESHNITGLYFYKNHNVETDKDEFSNDWFFFGTRSFQKVIDNFVVKNDFKSFTLSQAPIAWTEEGENPYISVFRNKKKLSDNEFFITNDVLVMKEVTIGDNLEVHTYNPDNMVYGSSGHYEIPLNLSANPQNIEITNITAGNVFHQFTEIMKSQKGFTGSVFANNNWRDTEQVKNYGKNILQHSAPLLRAMLLSSDESLDYMNACRFAETEYARFRAKFDLKIREFSVQGTYDPEKHDTKTWVYAALNAVAAGNTKSSPFYNSGMAVTGDRTISNFIPATPAYLGITPIYKPVVLVDDSIGEGELVIVGHDGSRTPIYKENSSSAFEDDYRNIANFYLENMIYESIDLELRSKERTYFDIQNLISGKFYQGPYSKEEFDLLVRPTFERWSVNYGVDYKTNTIFDENDPFTWNWSSCQDSDGEFLPGYWREIYRKYFDTDRPHTHPWEMLGFTDEPTWWASRYGTYPFTSANKVLWDDLEAGYIHSGSRQGVEKRWARPGLSKIIPIDLWGNLLDPHACGLATTYPMISGSANAPWVYGDGGPVESAWKRSYWYPFAVSQAGYLMKPAEFVEFNWDTVSFVESQKGTINEQILNKETKSRSSYREEYLHGEELNGQIVQKTGIQQWISDYLHSMGKDITETFGQKVRGLTVNLAYKVGGFTDTNNLLVVSDSFERIPSEDVKVQLYNSPSLSDEFYSGVVIEWTGTGWKVHGFDILNPNFTIIPQEETGSVSIVSVSSTNTQPVGAWTPNTQYTFNSLVTYKGKYFRCKNAHTSESNFDINYWTEVTKVSIVPSDSVMYYHEGVQDQYLTQIKYGHEFHDKQEVSNFLSSYERYLISRGWMFDQLSDDQTVTINWQYMTQLFLQWINAGGLNSGDFIALNPFSKMAKFTIDHGYVKPVEKMFNGMYNLLDQQGLPISPKDTSIVRFNGSITITPNSTVSQQLMGIRMNVAEVEHAIVFSNKTVFGDVIYMPETNIRQERLRVQGFMTSEWKGRISAPGFIISNDVLIPNFEKTADDFRTFFDIESIENTEMKQRARANIGYMEKDYFSNLLMPSTNQFEFYSSSIQNKGTPSSFNRILRSNYIRNNEGMQFLEEWAFRRGMYGSQGTTKSFDVQLKESEYSSNPQLIQFNGYRQGGWDQLFGWDLDHFDGIDIDSQAVIPINVNGISRIFVKKHGSGYQTIPDVKIVSDTGFGAVVTPELSWEISSVENIKILEGGYGFLVGDEIVIDGIGDGAKAKVKAIDATKCFIEEFLIDNPDGAGTGHKVGDMVKVLGGAGNGRGRITEVSPTGAVKKIIVTNIGVGYTDNAKIEFLNTTNQTGKDDILALMTGGPLTEIEIIDGGHGYDNTTLVKFTQKGIGAKCVVEVTGAFLSNIRVNDPGTGYLTVPTIEISGGDATTQAQALAYLDSNVSSGVKNLVSFAREEGVIIKEIIVKIIDGFNGTKPMLSIGDEDDNQRYMPNIGLGVSGHHKVTFEDADPRLNFDKEMNGYFAHTSSVGRMQIVVRFSVTAAYYQDVISDSSADNIIDVYDLLTNKNEFIYKDPRWVVRMDTIQPNWETVKVDLKDKGNLPNAGYVHLDDITWTIKNWNDFLTLYTDQKSVSPSTESQNELTVSFIDEETKPVRSLVFIPHLNKGIYRLKKVVFNILESFPTVDGKTATISLGTKTNPTKYMNTTEVDLSVVQEYNYLVYQFITDEDLDDNAIYLYYNQNVSLAIGSGKLVATASVELIHDSVLPGQRAWCYNTGLGDWTVERLGDSTMNVTATYPGSFEGQGTVVAASKNIFNTLKVDYNIANVTQGANEIESRMSKVVLDGVVGSQNNISMLNEIYSSKIKNQAKIFLDGSSLMTINGNVLTQHSMMNFIKNAGMVLNTLTVSVVTPFTTPEGRNPTLTVGTTTDPVKFIGPVQHNIVDTRGTPSRPSFTYGETINVNVFDETVTISEPKTPSSVDIRFVRSGNIFVTPTNIQVTNPGWGYSEGSNPKVTVVGPTGVKASAKIVGTIVGYEVTNPGSGYTSNPKVTVVGGEGTGALAIPVISNGKMKAVEIPGMGDNSVATPIMSGGSISGFIINNSGISWKMDPIVVLEGGSPNSHASVRAVLNSYGGVRALTIDSGGTGYVSQPTVKFLPHTGAGYTSTPRVIISGGGGSGATAEPVMMWRVESISIDDWGKCSWDGSNGFVYVDAPMGGAAPVAALLAEPSVPQPTTVQQYRYQVISPASHPQYGQWVYVGSLGSSTITFPAPTSTNNPNYWLQSVDIPITPVAENTIIKLEIPEYVYDATGNMSSVLNVINGIRGNTYTGTITIQNTVEGTGDIDLTKIGTKVFTFNQPVDYDDKLVAYYNPDGVTNGLLTIVADYHYNHGFELFTMDGKPVPTTMEGVGGDIFTWTTVRFPTIEDFEKRTSVPADGWQLGDIVEIDDGRDYMEKATVWNDDTQYELGQLVSHNGVIFRAIKGGDGAQVSVSIREGMLETVTWLNRGEKYSTAPQVTVVGDGTEAQVRAALVPTKIRSIRVVNGGRGYSTSEIVTVKSKYKVGWNAEAEISSVSPLGSILSMRILNPGWGFDDSPDIIIEGDERTGNNKAVFEVIMEPSYLQGFRIINRGKNYTHASLSLGSTKVTKGTFIESEWEVGKEAINYWKTKELQTAEFGSAWQTIRSQELQVNSSKLDDVSIYNKRTQEFIQNLQLNDPYKGFIPASADKELTFKLEYDPAIYSTGDDTVFVDEAHSWGEEQVGQLWWDLSTTRYLDYEIGDLSYRWRHWGQLCPKIEIDIYEWTESNVKPNNWEALVEDSLDSIDINRPTGFAKNNVNYVERQKFDETLGNMVTKYYFWVKNKTTIPTGIGREKTGAQVAYILQNPSTNGIPWFAVIGENKLLVGGVEQFLNDNDSTIQVKWKTVDTDVNDHKEWVLVRENDNRNSIDPSLWDKMTESLVGWKTSLSKTEVKSTVAKTFNWLSKTIQLKDASGLASTGEIKIYDQYIFYKYRDGNTLYGLDGLQYGKTYYLGETISQINTNEKIKLVPDKWLTEYERYGSLDHPSQTWFKTSQDSYERVRPGRSARKTFVETFNRILSREPVLDTRYEYKNVLESTEDKPASWEYSFVVSDNQGRNDLLRLNRISIGQKILIESTPEAYGFWTLWRYDPQNVDADEKGFVLEKAQRWRLQDGELWNAVDWYQEGFDKNSYPIITYDTLADRDAVGKIEVSLLQGTLVKVRKQSESDPRWSLCIYSDNGWYEVAKEKATIELSDNFYNDTNTLYGYDSFNFSLIPLRDGSWELNWILNNLKSFMTNLERNELFFAMVHSALAQNDFVDWVFKTSFLYMAGYNEELLPNPIAYKSQIENVVDYVNDVKPYHVKVRDYVKRYTSPIDDALIHITDFDKPLYYDETLNSGKGGWRKLDVTNNVDRSIMANSPEHKDWLANYQKTNYDLVNWDENWNPIRRIETSIVYDRVSCTPIIGWDPTEIPWDASVETWRGTTETHSLNYLSELYRRIPLKINKDSPSDTSFNWTKFKSVSTDYDVDFSAFVTALTVNGKRYYDANPILATLAKKTTIKLGHIVVLRYPDAANKVHSVWRKIDTTSWEKFSYRNITVETLADRDELRRNSVKSRSEGNLPSVQTGDIVYVLKTAQSFMWTGTAWEEFWASQWDTNIAGGLADRIETSYFPTLGMKRKSIPELISGCEYKGTELDGGPLNYGLWDMFPWDMEAGWENEYLYYVGLDTEINPNTRNWETGEVDAGDIFIDGGDFVQPTVDGCHPEELVKGRISSPLMITVYDSGRDFTKPVNEQVIRPASAMRYFRDALNTWELSFLDEKNILLAKDITSVDKQVFLYVPEDHNIYDPNDPPEELFDKIKPSMLYFVSYPESKLAQVGPWELTFSAKSLRSQWIPGSKLASDLQIVIDRIKKTFVEDSIVWLRADAAARQGLPILDEDVSEFGGKMKSKVVSVEVNSDTIVVNLNVLSVDETLTNQSSPKWSVIPNELVWTPGNIWVDDERISYPYKEEILEDDLINYGIDKTKTPSGYKVVALGITGNNQRLINRGIGGTSPGAPFSIKSDYRTGDGQTIAFMLPEGWNIEANIRVAILQTFYDEKTGKNKPHYWKYLSKGIDFQITEGQIIFTVPPGTSEVTLPSGMGNIKLDLVVNGWKNIIPVCHPRDLTEVEIDRMTPTHNSGFRRVYETGPLYSLPSGTFHMTKWPVNETMQVTNGHLTGGLVTRRLEWQSIMEEKSLAPVRDKK